MDALQATLFHSANSNSALAHVLHSLQAQAAEQTTSIASLSSKLDGALSRVSTLEKQLGGTKSKLAVEKRDNHQLRLRVDDQDRQIGQLAKRLDPYGTWEWSPKAGLNAEGGCFRWRASRHPGHRQPIAGGASPGLLALPVELLRCIASHLKTRDRRTLASVCFRWFDMLADELYSTARINQHNAKAFLAAKSSTSIRTGRLHRLRHTFELLLNRSLPYQGGSAGADIAPGGSFPGDFVSNLVILRVKFQQDLALDLHYWHAILSLCDPHTLMLERVPEDDLAPTITRIPALAFSFARSWRRCDVLQCYGRGSVPLLLRGSEGATERLAMTLRSGQEPWSFGLEKYYDDNEEQDAGAASLDDALAQLEHGMDGNEALIGLRASWR